MKGQSKSPVQVRSCVKIWGGEGADCGRNGKASTGEAGASLMCGLRFVVTQRGGASNDCMCTFNFLSLTTMCSFSQSQRKLSTSPELIS